MSGSSSPNNDFFDQSFGSINSPSPPPKPDRQQEQQQQQQHHQQQQVQHQQQQQQQNRRPTGSYYAVGSNNNSASTNTTNVAGTNTAFPAYQQGTVGGSMSTNQQQTSNSTSSFYGVSNPPSSTTNAAPSFYESSNNTGISSSSLAGPGVVSSSSSTMPPGSGSGSVESDWYSVNNSATKTNAPDANNNVNANPYAASTMNSSMNNNETAATTTTAAATPSPYGFSTPGTNNTMNNNTMMSTPATTTGAAVTNDLSGPIGGNASFVPNNNPPNGASSGGSSGATNGIGSLFKSFFSSSTTNTPNNNTNNEQSSSTNIDAGMSPSYVYGQTKPYDPLEFANEPPLLEELGVNVNRIATKSIAVLLPLRRFTDESINTVTMTEYDTAGPVLFAIVLGGELLLAGRVLYGYIYGIGLSGCLGLTLFVNLLSPVDSVSLLKVSSILGYGLLPVNLLAAVNILIRVRNMGAFGYVLALAVVGWCTVSCMRLFEGGCGLRDQRYLVGYPSALFYAAFVMLTIF